MKEALVLFVLALSGIDMVLLTVVLGVLVRNLIKDDF